MLVINSNTHESIWVPSIMCQSASLRERHQKGSCSGKCVEVDYLLQNRTLSIGSRETMLKALLSHLPTFPCLLLGVQVKWVINKIEKNQYSFMAREIWPNKMSLCLVGKSVLRGFWIHPMKMINNGLWKRLLKIGDEFEAYGSKSSSRTILRMGWKAL